MKVDEATWARCAPLLRQALDEAGNTHTLADVRAEIEADRAELWVSLNSVAVTEVLEYPRVKVLHVWLAAGALDEILAGDTAIERFARHVGASRLTVSGRPGWKKALAGRGYTARAVQLMRDL